MRQHEPDPTRLSVENNTTYTDDMVKAIKRSPIILTVVGKVNVGKTSWMRTMFADQQFGEVSDRPGQTKHFPNKEFRLPGSGVTYLQWFDSPGLTRCGKIMDALRDEVQEGQLPRADDLQRLIENMDRHKDIKPDLEILEHCRECDAILYLVDCQSAPLDGGPEEEQFRLIMMLKRPVVPIMNFVGHHIRKGRANAAAWRRMFESVGNHDALFMDAWERDRQEEGHLYDRLKQLFKDYPEKQDFIEYYQQRQARLVPAWLSRGCDGVASWLIDCVAYEARQAWTKRDQRQAIQHTLQSAVYDAISDAASERLADLCKQMTLPNVDEPKLRLEELQPGEVGVGAKAKDNPFVREPSEALKQGQIGKLVLKTKLSRVLFSYKMFRKYGSTVGKGAAAGTAAGLVVDLFTPTFGAATIVGSVSGGTIGALMAKGSEVVFNHHDRSVSAFLTKEGLSNVVGLSLALLDHLYRRGAANTEPITARTLRSVDSNSLKVIVEMLQGRITGLSPPRKKRWCSIHAKHDQAARPDYKEPALRTEFREKLAEHISEVIQKMKGARHNDERLTRSASAAAIRANLKSGADRIRSVVNRENA